VLRTARTQSARRVCRERFITNLRVFYATVTLSLETLRPSSRLPATNCDRTTLKIPKHTFDLLKGTA
jgi:hypothetical protein